MLASVFLSARHLHLSISNIYNLHSDTYLYTEFFCGGHEIFMAYIDGP